MNVGRAGEHAPESVRTLGVTWIRIVALPALDLSDYFRRCRQSGLKVLLVLARESGQDWQAYVDRYAHVVDAVQVGNEPDLASPSSWSMTQADFVQLGQLARELFGPAMPLVTAGLASGHPEWLQGVDLAWADAVAVHPYLKDAPNPSDLEDLPDVNVLLDQYKAFGKPLIVSEWGWWGTDEKRGREEVSDMAMWAAHTGQIAAYFHFCYTDAMVPPFGLYRADGTPKPALDAFKQAAPLAVNYPWPPAKQAPAENDPWRYWSAEQAASATGANLAHVRDHWPHIAAQLVLVGIYDRPTAIAAFATVVVEIGARFEPIHEYGTPADWARYSGGAAYAGRGYIQLTHDYNYQTYTEKLTELWGPGAPDLYANPDLALDPDVAGAVLALYFKDHGIPAMAASGNWSGVRQTVNGGMNGWQVFADAVEALKAISPAVSTPEPEPVPSPDDKDHQIAALTIALKTLRDATLPDIEQALDRLQDQEDEARKQLKEAQRICVQFVGAA